MYASVQKYSVLPGSVDEWTRRVQAEFVPLLSTVSGFIAYYALEGSNDEVVTVSIFDTHAGAEASVLQAADWVTKHGISFQQGVSEITADHVRIFQAASAAPASSPTRTPDDDHGPYSSSVPPGTHN
jgi:hypothetical protein